MGDIPDAEMKPPDNVLFVRPINPVTQVSIILDTKTGLNKFPVS